MKHIAKFTATAALILMTATCGYRLVRNGEINEPLVNDIKREVSNTRGLEFKNDVEIVLISQSEVGAFFEKDLHEQFPPQKIDALQRTYTILGFIDPDTDLKSMVLEFYSENVAGFYDPTTKKLYLVRESVEGFSFISFLLRRDVNAEMVLAHELTHALDDQNFNLDGMEDNIQVNDDELLAMQALEEGTATLVGFAVMYRSLFGLDDIMSGITADPEKARRLAGMTIGDAPTILIDTAVFAYINGAGFVSYLYRQSQGWENVDRAYTRPPRSSEEVLYPEKYIDGVDPPDRVELLVSPESFGENWETVEINTLGELALFSLLRRFVDTDRAQSAASGWGGDRYVVLGTPDGAETLLILVTKWDNIAEADEFRKAYIELLHNKYKSLEPVECDVGDGECFSDGAGELVWIGKSGRHVGIVEGATPETMPIAVRYAAPTVLVMSEPALN